MLRDVIWDVTRCPEYRGVLRCISEASALVIFFFETWRSVWQYRYIHLKGQCPCMCTCSLACILILTPCIWVSSEPYILPDPHLGSFPGPRLKLYEGKSQLSCNRKWHGLGNEANPNSNPSQLPAEPIGSWCLNFLDVRSCVMVHRM